MKPVAQILGELFILFYFSGFPEIITSLTAVDVDCGNKSTLGEVAYVKY